MPNTQHYVFCFLEMKRFLLILLLALASASAKVSYDGHSVWRIKIANPLEANDFKRLANKFTLDVWSESKSFVDVHIRPENVRALQVDLSRFRLSFETIIPDIGVLIKEEEKRLGLKPFAFALDHYNTYEEITGYLQDLSSTNDYAFLESAGQTFEGRDLWMLKVSTGTGKPSVWIECNIHAREWISGATCLYGIDLLTGSYGTDPDVTSLLDKYDFYIIPIANPDGYKWTWNDTDGDRMWRKNRGIHEGNLCIGTDLNRNFDDHFGGEGTSNNSCADTYHGPSPASEPETKAFQNTLLNLVATADLQVMFSIHSYAQLWMYPFGWTTNLPDNADQLNELSMTGVNALTAVHGTKYDYGPIAVTIYPASGSTVDFGYDNGVLLGFALELRDTGRYGFALPEDQITPTGEETWAGIIATLLDV